MSITPSNNSLPSRKFKLWLSRKIDSNSLRPYIKVWVEVTVSELRFTCFSEYKLLKNLKMDTRVIPCYFDLMQLLSFAFKCDLQSVVDKP